ncbi:LysR family transcriptional regulator [Staphylococcus pseudoxylosus]|uniref:LysR family transcriptional regulator n=1 Tax=Staphylococcus pseudoxylosus TaxID=2282419 RepID=UPI002DB97C6D|nr:LysR family transcriptional regulator [Staphylococcus pseudoxylosus]MEB6170573.1 LysR family transcriptional regulator [Staphylococcus pseudoxylosus]
MNYKQLKTLKLLIETGSYTKTAEILNYTQSNISQQISQLENELENSLFINHNKSVIQTDFLKNIMPLINDYIDVHEQIINISKYENSRGKIKIAAPESLLTSGLSNFIKYFLESYPEIDIDLFNNTCSFNQQQLLNGNVDIAFVVNEDITNKYLQKHKLDDEQIVLVAHMDAPDTLDLLLKDNTFNHLIINEKDSTYRQMFEKYIFNNDYHISKTTEMWSIDSIKSLITQRIGFSVLPFRNVKNEIKNRKLKIIKTDHPFPLFQSFALVKKKNWTNPILNLFLKEIKNFNN